MSEAPFDPHTSLMIGEQCACLAARRVARTVSRLYDSHMAPSGLTTTQFTLLNCIAALSTPRIGDVASALDLEQTTLSRNLRVLQDQKLIEVVSETKDRRARCLRLSRRGATALKRAIPYWQVAQNEFEARFGKDQWQTALPILWQMSKVCR